MEPIKVDYENFSAKDGTILKGLFLIPEKPKAVALVLPGSGNVGIDGDVSSPFLGSPTPGLHGKVSDQISRELFQKGVASFRYEKRGFADASKLPEQRFPFLKDDALAAVAFMKEHFPNLPLYLVGFSEGALVASLIATETNAKALFLLGLPSRPLSSLLRYQFLQWPLELIRQKLDLDKDGIISANDIKVTGFSGKLPLLGDMFQGLEWEALDADGDGKLSIANDIQPAYEKNHQGLMDFVRGPAFGPWYNSFEELPSYESIAKQIDCSVFLYHGTHDAQTAWDFVEFDKRYFKRRAEWRLFEGLGHCFSPMLGALGELKTTGPIDSDVLFTLGKDVLFALEF